MFPQTLWTPLPPPRPGVNPWTPASQPDAKKYCTAGFADGSSTFLLLRRVTGWRPSAAFEKRLIATGPPEKRPPAPPPTPRPPCVKGAGREADWGIVGDSLPAHPRRGRSEPGHRPCPGGLLRRTKGVRFSVSGKSNSFCQTPPPHPPRSGSGCRGTAPACR